MAELIPRERLQPALLVRLTDDQPEKTHEAMQERVLTMRQLRRSVLRDLAWLLNTSNMEAGTNLSYYPLVAKSVLNYGLPDLTGRVVSGMTDRQLEALLREAILRFEPRILPNTLRVRAIIAGDQMNRNAIGFEVEGELWSQPVPTHLLIKTEIDVESGHFAVSDSGATGAVD